MSGRAVLLGVAAVAAACASTARFHPGATSLDAREQRAMMAVGRGRPDGFQRFWLRPKCQPGLVKWSVARSRSVPDAPAGVLDLIRDEIGRVNARPRGGEVVFVTVAVFGWERRWFGRAPRIGYEIVGRDRAGQVVWMGEDSLVAPRESALNLSEPDELLVAREIGRKLKAELGL